MNETLLKVLTHVGTMVYFVIWKRYFSLQFATYIKISSTPTIVSRCWQHLLSLRKFPTCSTSSVEECLTFLRVKKFTLTNFVSISNIRKRGRHSNKKNGWYLEGFRIDAGQLLYRHYSTKHSTVRVLFLDTLEVEALSHWKKCAKEEVLSDCSFSYRGK